MKYLDDFAELLLRPVATIVTTMLGIYTVCWGLWVLNPFVETFSSAHLYSQLLVFIPLEWVWGTIAILAGLLTLFGLVKHFPRTIFFGAGASAAFWFIISIFYFMGDATNTGGITALFLSILAAYIYLNCKVNYVRDSKESNDDC